MHNDEFVKKPSVQFKYTYCVNSGKLVWLFTVLSYTIYNRDRQVSNLFCHIRWRMSENKSGLTFAELLSSWGLLKGPCDCFCPRGVF